MSVRERLHELFRYDGATGELIFRERPGQPQFNTAYAGKVAGRRNTSGQMQTNVDGKVRLVHRIIYKMLYNVEPNRIRHLNGDVSDNRPSNLGAAPPPKPHRIDRRKDESGVTGVSWNPARRVWFGMVQSNYARHYVGSWKTLDDRDTIRAQVNAARALLPDCRKQRYRRT